MTQLSYEEFCFYYNELHRTANESVNKFGVLLNNNLHNEAFDPEKAQEIILMKYFPEVYNKQTTR